MKKLSKALIMVALLNAFSSQAQTRNTILIGENDSFRVFFDCPAKYGNKCYSDTQGGRYVDVTWQGINKRAGDAPLYTSVLLNCKNGTYDENASGKFVSPKQNTLFESMVKMGCRL